ncbi:MAG TPA: YXWGXW repeat-containing protein [Bryobacteraceae bacterium]|nr:YXWGXW repeat-containing protein [Bryobacteraceae bacterium]
MKRLLLVALVGVGSAFAIDFSVGINIGPPPPPRVLAVHPPAPGPDYVWVDGYWYPVNGRYVWHAGYWSRPPYPGAVWVVPHHEGGHWFQGYWEGGRGRVAHEHKWDRERERDYNRFHDEHDRH